MDFRLHPYSVAPAEGHEKCAPPQGLHATTPPCDPTEVVRRRPPSAQFNKVALSNRPASTTRRCRRSSYTDGGTRVRGNTPRPTDCGCRDDTGRRSVCRGPGRASSHDGTWSSRHAPSIIAMSRSQLVRTSTNSNRSPATIIAFRSGAEICLHFYRHQTLRPILTDSRRLNSTVLMPNPGVVARILTGPHDAHRQDPHLPMRYDTGRPRAVIRLRISQPRTTCPSRIRCQAATGSWTKARQWETERTLFSSARATMCPPARVNGVWPVGGELVRTRG